MLFLCYVYAFLCFKYMLWALFRGPGQLFPFLGHPLIESTLFLLYLAHFVSHLIIHTILGQTVQSWCPFIPKMLPLCLLWGVTMWGQVSFSALETTIGRIYSCVLAWLFLCIPSYSLPSPVSKDRSMAKWPGNFWSYYTLYSKHRMHSDNR